MRGNVTRPFWKNLPIAQMSATAGQPGISNYRRHICFEIPAGTSANWNLWARETGSGDPYEMQEAADKDGPDPPEGSEFIYYQFPRDWDFVDIYLVDTTPPGPIYTYPTLVNPNYVGTDYGNSPFSI